MSKILESDDMHDKMRKSILQHSLTQKLASYNRSAKDRPEKGWMPGSSQDAQDTRQLGDLDKFYQSNWKHVGPRDPLSSEELSDKKYWDTRDTYATKAYNQAFDANAKDKQGDFPEKEKTQRAERLKDLENWWDSVDQKRHDHDFGKQWGEKQKGFADPTKLATSPKEIEKQRKMLERELSSARKQKRSSLMKGELDRKPKKTTTESIMNDRIQSLVLILEKKKKQDSLAAAVTKGSSYMIDPKTGGQAKATPPKNETPFQKWERANPQGSQHSGPSISSQTPAQAARGEAQAARWAADAKREREAQARGGGVFAGSPALQTHAGQKGLAASFLAAADLASGYGLAKSAVKGGVRLYKGGANVTKKALGQGAKKVDPRTIPSIRPRVPAPSPTGPIVRTRPTPTSSKLGDFAKKVVGQGAKPGPHGGAWGSTPATGLRGVASRGYGHLKTGLGKLKDKFKSGREGSWKDFIGRQNPSRPLRGTTIAAKASRALRGGAKHILGATRYVSPGLAGKTFGRFSPVGNIIRKLTPGSPLTSGLLKTNLRYVVGTGIGYGLRNVPNVIDNPEQHQAMKRVGDALTAPTRTAIDSTLDTIKNFKPTYTGHLKDMLPSTKTPGTVKDALKGTVNTGWETAIGAAKGAELGQKAKRSIDRNFGGIATPEPAEKDLTSTKIRNLRTTLNKATGFGDNPGDFGKFWGGDGKSPTTTPKATITPKATPTTGPKATSIYKPITSPTTPKATPKATPKVTTTTTPKATPKVTTEPKPEEMTTQQKQIQAALDAHYRKKEERKKRMNPKPIKEAKDARQRGLDLIAKYEAKQKAKGTKEPKTTAGKSGAIRGKLEGLAAADAIKARTNRTRSSRMGGYGPSIGMRGAGPSYYTKADAERDHPKANYGLDKPRLTAQGILDSPAFKPKKVIIGKGNVGPGYKGTDITHDKEAQDQIKRATTDRAGHKLIPRSAGKPGANRRITGRTITGKPTYTDDPGLDKAFKDARAEQVRTKDMEYHDPRRLDPLNNPTPRSAEQKKKWLAAHDRKIAAGKNRDYAGNMERAERYRSGTPEPARRGYEWGKVADRGDKDLVGQGSNPDGSPREYGLYNKPKPAVSGPKAPKPEKGSYMGMTKDTKYYSTKGGSGIIKEPYDPAKDPKTLTYKHDQAMADIKAKEAEVKAEKEGPGPAYRGMSPEQQGKVLDYNRTKRQEAERERLDRSPRMAGAKAFYGKFLTRMGKKDPMGIDMSDADLKRPLDRGKWGPDPGEHPVHGQGPGPDPKVGAKDYYNKFLKGMGEKPLKKTFARHGQGKASDNVLLSKTRGERLETGEKPRSITPADKATSRVRAAKRRAARKAGEPLPKLGSPASKSSMGGDLASALSPLAGMFTGNAAAKAKADEKDAKTARKMKASKAQEFFQNLLSKK